MINYKPVLHFRPAKNWINDANGLIWHDGWYHMFYQYNPHAPVWGDIHWGHARSRDLLHWQHLPVALCPAKETGEEHCFSGNILISEGQPYLFYTSIGPQHGARDNAQQWLALGSSDLCRWQRWPENPLMDTSVNGSLQVYDWRDPFVWQQEQTYYMVLGGETEGRGCVLLYHSPDLFSWSQGQLLYLSEQYRGCECPVFFQLADRWVLLFSPYQSVVAVVGRFTDERQFVPEYEQIVDYGGREGFYAINTLLDQQGKRIAFGWITDSDRDAAQDLALDWHGIQSLPRQLDLHDGRLYISPAPIVRSLRKNDIILKHLAQQIEGVLDGPAEVYLEIKEQPEPVELVLANHAGERLRLEIDFRRLQIILDRSQSSRHPDIRRSNLVMPFSGTELKLNILIDQSVIEICANDETWLTSRFYPLYGQLERLSMHWAASGCSFIADVRAWLLELDQAEPSST